MLVELTKDVRAPVYVGQQNWKRQATASVQTQTDHHLVDQTVLLFLVHERVVGEIEDYVLLEQLGGDELVPDLLFGCSVPDDRVEVATWGEKKL